MVHPFGTRREEEKEKRLIRSLSSIFFYFFVVQVFPISIETINSSSNDQFGDFPKDEVVIWDLHQCHRRVVRQMRVGRKDMFRDRGKYSLRPVTESQGNVRCRGHASV